jgi:hypothetical protein
MAIERRSERETAGEIIETQDEALQKKYHATKILQSVTNNKCGLCQILTTQYTTLYQHAE